MTMSKFSEVFIIVRRDRISLFCMLFRAHFIFWDAMSCRFTLVSEGGGDPRTWTMEWPDFRCEFRLTQRGGSKFVSAPLCTENLDELGKGRVFPWDTVAFVEQQETWQWWHEVFPKGEHGAGCWCWSSWGKSWLFPSWRNWIPAPAWSMKKSDHSYSLYGTKHGIRRAVASQISWFGGKMLKFKDFPAVLSDLSAPKSSGGSSHWRC